MKPLSPWLPAIAGMLCLGLGSGLIGIYGFFVDDLSREFSVGVAQLNIAPVALLLVPGLVAPLVGRLADRLPIRNILLAGITLAMASLFAISRAESLGLAALGFLFFALGLTCYGPVVVNGLLVKLYAGAEARALAIAAIGISLATAVLPPVSGFLLANLDWRQTLAILALGIVVLLWLVVLLFVPKDAGLATADIQQQAANKLFLRQSSFWLIGFCVALGLSGALLLAICYPPHFLQRGFSVEQAAWLVSCTGLAGLVGKAAVAWAGDAARQLVRWLAAALLLLQALGLVLLLLAQSQWLVFAGVCCLGFGAGGFLPMHPYLNARYFSTQIISQVNGAQMPLLLPFGLIGPPLAGWVFDRFGSYDLVLIALALIYVSAASLMLFLKNPHQ